MIRQRTTSGSLARWLGAIVFSFVACLPSEEDIGVTSNAVERPDAPDAAAPPEPTGVDTRTSEEIYADICAIKARGSGSSLSATDRASLTRLWRAYAHRRSQQAPEMRVRLRPTTFIGDGASEDSIPDEVVSRAWMPGGEP